MRVLLLGRHRPMMDAATSLAAANGFDNDGVLTDEEAVAAIETGRYSAVTIGGGVEPDSRLRVKGAAAKAGIVALDVFGPDDLIRKLKELG